jgi:hypothetical protein
MGILSCAFEADGANEGIEIIDKALIEAIKLRSPLGLKPCVCFDGAEKACGECVVSTAVLTLSTAVFSQEPSQRAGFQGFRR